MIAFGIEIKTKIEREAREIGIMIEIMILEIGSGIEIEIDIEIETENEIENEIVVKGIEIVIEIGIEIDVLIGEIEIESIDILQGAEMRRNANILRIVIVTIAKMIPHIQRRRPIPTIPMRIIAIMQLMVVPRHQQRII